MGLELKLLALRPKMVQAAQEILDEWITDEEGMDEEFGGGGACDAINMALAGIIAEEMSNINIADGGQEGDDHAYTVVYDSTEAYAVDIPATVYETGGGYSWKKREGIQLELNDISITPIEREWIADWDENL